MDLDRLEARLDRPAPVRWEPEPGHRLVGIVDLIRYITLPSSATIGIVTVETRDGELVELSASRSALRRPLVDYKVQVGDAIAVEYLGEQPVRDGSRQFHAYKVAVDCDGPRRAGETFDPDAHATDADLGLLDDIALPRESPMSEIPW